MLFSVAADAAAAGSASASTGLGGSSILITVGYLAFFIVIMYLLIFLPQRRRDKKAKDMLGALQVGHSVVTIGGISGKVLNIKDDEVTIETGVEKAKICVKKWAVKEVVKPIES